MMVLAQMDVFVSEALFFHEPSVSPIVGTGDIGQVSTAKSSIHFKYFYLLKISAEDFPFVTKEKSLRNLYIFFLSPKIYTKMCGFSETYIQKDMQLLTNAHAVRCSRILAVEIST